MWHELCLLCLLFGTASAEAFYFGYKDGEVSVNKGSPLKVDGPVYIELVPSANLTRVSGTRIDNGVYTHFAFAGAITKFWKDDNKVEVEAQCKFGSWINSPLVMLKGKVTITGTLDQLRYQQSCTDVIGNVVYDLKATATTSVCPIIYSAFEAAQRSQRLVGLGLYSSPFVLNHAYYGYPYMSFSCKDYLNNFPERPKAVPGYAIVGTDGAHCGILDAEADKFAHVDPVAKDNVILTPLSLAKNYFPKGFVFKEIKC